MSFRSKSLKSVYAGPVMVGDGGSNRNRLDRLTVCPAAMKDGFAVFCTHSDAFEFHVRRNSCSGSPTSEASVEALFLHAARVSMLGP